MSTPMNKYFMNTYSLENYFPWEKIEDLQYAKKNKTCTTSKVSHNFTFYKLIRSLFP